MPTFSDYLYQQVAGTVQPVSNTWVQLVNNSTGLAYLSAAATTTLGLYTVTAPAGVYTINTGSSPAGPWTATGDVNYSVANRLDWANILDFGGKPDGTSDNTAALTSAIASLPSAIGTVYFPAAAQPYVFASAWAVQTASRVRFQGAGPTGTGGTATSTLIRFTTTSGPLIAASGTTGLELEDLYIQWPSSFAGTVVDFSATTFNAIRRCAFFTNGTGITAALLVGLDSSTRCVIERCLFHNAQVAIQGLSSGVHFSNIIAVRDCNFGTAQPNGDIQTACIQNVGQGWEITGNTFEMGQLGGNCVVVSNTLGNNGPGVLFAGNWIGDQGANAITQVTAGQGWTITGNYFGGAAATTAISVPNNTPGVSILGNFFQTYSVGTLIGTSVSRFVYSGNQINTVTTEISGSPTTGMVTLGGQVNTYGLLQSQGTLQFLGAERRSVRAPAFTTPFTPDPTLGERTEMTLTAALTVNAPTNGVSGMRLEFWWIQDGTGGRTITYNAVYHTSTGAAIVTTASTVTIDVFECQSDNTTWRLVSRATGQT
jgi:Pectate lyase superfamily protein